ncbi:MAG: hypothetical protein MUC95_07270 [Spirochaetes bacterium]|jgi:hypothetical protein|nr:hypothetical protein [Spirochaetota bacterium]
MIDINRLLQLKNPCDYRDDRQNRLEDILGSGVSLIKKIEARIKADPA